MGFAVCLPHYETPSYALENVVKAIQSEKVNEIVIVDDFSGLHYWEELRTGLSRFCNGLTPMARFALPEEPLESYETFSSATDNPVAIKLVRFGSNRGPFVNKFRAICLTESQWALLLDPDNTLDISVLKELVAGRKNSKEIWLAKGHWKAPEEGPPRWKGFPLVLRSGKWSGERVAQLLNAAGPALRGNLYYFLNTGNFVCDTTLYKRMPVYETFDPGSGDVIELLKLWFSRGGTVRINRRFVYLHRLRDSSHWATKGSVDEIYRAVSGFEGFLTGQSGGLFLRAAFQLYGFTSEVNSLLKRALAKTRSVLRRSIRKAGVGS